MVVDSDDDRFGSIRTFTRVYSEFCCSALHLHAVLIEAYNKTRSSTNYIAAMVEGT